VASGLYNTTVQVGGAIGLAVLSTLATSRTHHLAATGATRAEALTGGFHLAIWGAAAAAALAAALATVVLRPARQVEVEQTAELVGAGNQSS
jgi:hypothetical protein